MSEQLKGFNALKHIFSLGKDEKLSDERKGDQAVHVPAQYTQGILIKNTIEYQNLLLEILVC